MSLAGIEIGAGIDIGNGIRIGNFPVGVSFTVQSTDFTNYGTSSNTTATDTTGFVVANLNNYNYWNLYDEYGLNNAQGSIATTIANAFASAGFDTNNAYAWTATWGPGSTYPTTLVRLAWDGGVWLFMIPIDTSTVSATAIVPNYTYQITTVGDTDFTAIGAANNTVGTVFTSTAAGTGTGTATNYWQSGASNLNTVQPLAGTYKLPVTFTAYNPATPLQSAGNWC